MKVWLCPSAFHPHLGGVEELTRQLAVNLQLLGHEVVVVTNQWPRDLPPHGEHDGIRIERIPFSLPARHPRSWMEHAALRGRALSRLLDLPAPDLLHVQCGSSQLSPIRRLRRHKPVPLVFTTQGETVMDAQGVYQRNAHLRRQFRLVSREANALTACSAWTRDRAIELAPAFGAAEVILNGVDPADWRDTGRPPAEPVFGAYGRLVPQKGFDLLIEAMDIVRAELPDARLLLGGSGPDDAKLRQLAGAGVSFLGPLDRSGVRQLLARSRVIVVPSRLEPFGIVALEALAGGRGLVYSDHGGLKEAAADCGRAFSSNDPHDLARAMLAEHRNPTDSGQGRARAMACSWPQIARGYESIYERVLAT